MEGTRIVQSHEMLISGRYFGSQLLATPPQPTVISSGQLCVENCRRLEISPMRALVEYRVPSDHVHVEPAVALEERFFKIGKIRYVRTCT